MAEAGKRQHVVMSSAWRPGMTCLAFILLSSRCLCIQHCRHILLVMTHRESVGCIFPNQCEGAAEAVRAGTLGMCRLTFWKALVEGVGWWVTPAMMKEPAIPGAITRKAPRTMNRETDAKLSSRLNPVGWLTGSFCFQLVAGPVVCGDWQCSGPVRSGWEHMNAAFASLVHCWKWKLSVPVGIPGLCRVHAFEGVLHVSPYCRCQTKNPSHFEPGSAEKPHRDKAGRIPGIEGLGLLSFSFLCFRFSCRVDSLDAGSIDRHRVACQGKSVTAAYSAAVTGIRCG